MKHLLKFNESNNDDKITDKDFELIENCFLDYVTGTYQGEYIPRKYTLDRIQSSDGDYVLITFSVPIFEAPPASYNTQEEYRKYIIAREYPSWKWAHGFIKEITGDIKRCESYGFECLFDFYLSCHTPDPAIWLIVRQKTSRRSSSFNIEGAYAYTKQMIETPQPTPW